jgi:acetyl esterase
MSTIDPRVAEYLRALSVAPQLDFDLERFRAALAGHLRNAGERRALEQVVDVHRPGAAGLRVYRPDRAAGHPVLLYLHGGAFVRGDLEAADVPCREVAARGPVVVVSVDYRLAPEHPYPAAVDDALAAVGWAQAEIATYGGNPAAISIGGDSAGATIAAVVARELGTTLASQILIAGVFDLADRLPPAAGPLDTTEDQKRLSWIADLYAGSRPADDPLVSPLRHPGLHNSAPALVVTSELDPFREQAHRYAAALTAAGVAVDIVDVAGLPHGFTNLAGLFAAEAHDVYERVATAVRSSVAPSSAGDTVRR